MKTLSSLPANRFFRFPFSFDIAQLEQDLATCQKGTWVSHFNQADYAGQWSSIALRSLSGSETDIRSLPGIYQDTPLLLNCPYFREIIQQFACTLESVRLLSLAPGSIIHPHQDREAGYEYGFFRLHIPIQTGEQVLFEVDGEALPMRPGECWYANFNLLHSVRNEGGIDRIHLVLDGRRNTWSDGLFASAGYNFESEQQRQQPTPEVRRQIIAELARQDTETARRLIAQLEQEEANQQG